MGDSRMMQLGRSARGWRNKSEYKKRGNRVERRRARQLVIEKLQDAPTRRRYLDWY